MVIEILNNVIRKEIKIKGVKTKGEEYKLQAFAYDLVFILEEPAKSIQTLKEELEKYGEVAGMKVNYNKTKILTKNMTKSPVKALEAISKFQLASQVKYFSNIITNKNSNLFDKNYKI